MLSKELKLLAKQRVWQEGGGIISDLAVDAITTVIVKECIKRIAGCTVVTDDDDQFVKGYNKGVSKVASQVKAHFGFDNE
jgi:hypothetical protein